MTTKSQTASDTKDAISELLSWSEWKDTFREIHNSPSALRQLSVFGYIISFALGGLTTLLAVILLT